MQKLVLTVFICTLFSLTSFGQTGSGYGFKVGLNYTGNGDYFESISTNFESPDRNIGYHIGIYGKIGNRLYFRPELVYTKTKSDFDSGEFDVQKIDAPLLVGIKVLGPISIFAGPAIEYIIDSDFERLNVNDIENDFTVGFNFGVALNFNSFGLDLRYERGFSNNEATFLDNNNLLSADRLDARSDQLILSLSIKI
ncbi:outer membrane beta-barrel protein [Winogradskyella immobilis]|uniref:Outer membrane beta-barrel protein n=1 Tax=Winogradskyella immobilis TaxID=2816852 RepID=A0ABS8EP75_9FLAO|nr:outer membrane beta-barrel protein [Winogradskyella immobilis]MCC1485018.1 outer membrane beta-barrel protein [Winogradskyella immobilis]MCG0017110.1 PorT family protein [Winogradskyella immobilis]